MARNHYRLQPAEYVNEQFPWHSFRGDGARKDNFLTVLYNVTVLSFFEKRDCLGSASVLHQRQFWVLPKETPARTYN